MQAAITDEPETGHTYTEGSWPRLPRKPLAVTQRPGAADWNMKSSLDRNPYYFSKRLAEQAATKRAEELKQDLVLINVGAHAAAHAHSLAALATALAIERSRSS